MAGHLHVLYLVAILCGVSEFAMSKDDNKAGGCLANLMTFAGVSKRDASKYESKFARYRLTTKVAKGLSAAPLNLLLGVSNKDSIKLASCFQAAPRSPAKCRQLSSHECSGRGACLAKQKSKPFYQCVCRSPFIGVLCEKRPNFCKPRNPCANGGVCRSNAKGFTCRCPRGYSGSKCQDYWLSEKSFDKKLARVDSRLTSLTTQSASQHRALRLQMKQLLARRPVAHRPRYKLLKRKMTHAEGSRACTKLGMRMALPRNKAENAIVSKLCGNKACWLGATDIRQEGRWVDASGKLMRYTNWNSGEPNNENKVEDCANINWESHPTQTWNDIPCSFKIPTPCQSS